jgi:hypothetical protein
LALNNEKVNLIKVSIMALQVEDLEDQTRFRQILKIPYEELVNFVLDYIRRRTGVMVFFWSVCTIFLGIAVIVRINITGYYPLKNIISHTILGLIIFPLVSIPVHEALHVIPFLLAGARKIRVGIDLKQYIFYVTAHRYVINSGKFRFVALVPFIIINLMLLIMIWSLPGLWKWSISLFLFVHTTMCAGDFALLNFYYINRKKKIYTWDDADQKMAYFYEEI